MPMVYSLRPSRAEGVELVYELTEKTMKSHALATWRTWKEHKASAVHKPIRLRVLSVNAAKRFYEAHGFSVIEETPERVTMELV